MPIKIHKKQRLLQSNFQTTKNELGFLEKLWLCLLEETLTAAHPDDTERETEREREGHRKTSKINRKKSFFFFWNIQLLEKYYIALFLFFFILKNKNKILIFLLWKVLVFAPVFSKVSFSQPFALTMLWVTPVNQHKNKKDLWVLDLKILADYFLNKSYNLLNKSYD